MSAHVLLDLLNELKNIRCKIAEHLIILLQQV